MEFSENIQKFILAIAILCITAMLLKHLFMNVEESEASKYLKENYVKIFSIITIIVFFIMVFSVLGVDFSKSDESTLVDQYVVENFKSKSRYLPESYWRTKGKGFCQAITKNSKTHKKACKQLSFSNCSQFTNCCAAVNGSDESSYDCVPASSGGPLFTKDNFGKNIDFYWYKGKCNGRACNLNREQYNRYKQERNEIKENVEKNQDILNQAKEEAKKQEKNSCNSDQKVCYLWGTPDANISPFG